MGLKMSEILLILAALLLLFGASRLPTLGSSLGQAIRNFKKGFNTEETPEDAEAAKKASLSSGGRVESNEAAKVASKDR